MGFFDFFRARHREVREQRKQGENIPPNTSPIDEKAALEALGWPDFNTWRGPGYSNSGQSRPYQWAPEPFVGDNLEAWQKNWNALPAGLRFAYGSALEGSGTPGSQLLRTIAQYQGQSFSKSGEVISHNEMAGTNFAIANGQLYMTQKNSNGTFRTYILANLVDPTAMKKIGIADSPAYRAMNQILIDRGL